MNNHDNQGNEQYITTRDRRNLPQIPNEENLVNLDQEQRQGNQEEFSSNMKPVPRLLTMREQNILQQAEQLGFECQVIAKSTNLPRSQANDYQNLARGRDLNLQNYYNIGGLQSNQGPINSIRQKAVNNVLERDQYNFRPIQRYAGNVEPRRDIGGPGVETHRARFVEILSPDRVQIGRETRKLAPQERFPGGRGKYDEITSDRFREEPDRFPHTSARFPKPEPKYDQIIYNTGETKRRELGTQTGAGPKVPLYDRHYADRTPTKEQWETIETVRSSIGGGAHLYEEPIIPQQRNEQRGGPLQWVHKDLANFRGQTLSEARALTPDEEKDERDWQQEMLKNINALAITGGHTQLQTENFLIQEQERRRVEIELQLAHINTLNQRINSEVHSNNESPENEDDLYDFQNVLCSTDPALIDQNYQTRLELMRGVQEKLGKVVRRKSKRLQKMQAEKVDLRGLSKKERGNLEYN